MLAGSAITDVSARATVTELPDTVSDSETFACNASNPIGVEAVITQVDAHDVPDPTYTYGIETIATAKIVSVLHGDLPLDSVRIWMPGGITETHYALATHTAYVVANERALLRLRPAPADFAVGVPQSVPENAPLYLLGATKPLNAPDNGGESTDDDGAGAPDEGESAPAPNGGESSEEVESGPVENELSNINELLAVAVEPLGRINPGCVGDYVGLGCLDSSGGYSAARFAFEWPGIPSSYRVNSNTSDKTGESLDVQAGANKWTNDTSSWVSLAYAGSTSVARVASNDGNVVFLERIVKRYVRVRRRRLHRAHLVPRPKEQRPTLWRLREVGY